MATTSTTISTSTLAPTTPGPTTPDYLNQDDIDDLQTQLYIISGVFGGIIVILAILVVLLAVAVSSLKKKLNKQKKAVSKQTVPEPDLYGGSLSNGAHHDSQGTFGRRTGPPTAAVVSDEPRPGYGWERRGHRESVHDPVQFGPREGQGQRQGQDQGQRHSRNPSLQQHESWELEQHKPNNPRSSSRYSGRRSYQQELGSSKYY